MKVEVLLTLKEALHEFYEFAFIINGVKYHAKAGQTDFTGSKDSVVSVLYK